MPVLGVESVISAREAEPGRFYLQEMYNEDPVLFLCFLTGGRIDDVPEVKALYFQPTGERRLSVHLMPTYETLVALPQVHIRVDAHSLLSTNTTSALQTGMMIVIGNTPFVAAPLEFRHWTLVNLHDGRATPIDRTTPWAAFSRWQLVLDDAGEEVVIADFQS